MVSLPPSQPASAKPVIGVTMGEPAGVGPEVVIKALSDPAIRRSARFVIYGMNELMSYAADLAEIEPFWWRLQHDSARAEFDFVHDVIVLDYDQYSMLGQAVHRPTKQGGQASLGFLDDAVAHAMRPAGQPGHLDALVTAPICKESWKMAGCRYPGHTEFLQSRTKSKRVVMMFDSPKLRVSLATTHLPLMEVRHRFTIGTVFDAIDLGVEGCHALGVSQPRVAVTGLNPHASENGQFGDEEERVIQPAIEMARSNGVNVKGPFPADTIFNKAVKGSYDLVVAMYHDQGLIPIKLLAFDEAVNITMGLPIIRTSPDHGTAFDIVGKNKAEASSMKAAIRTATQMANARKRLADDSAGQAG